MAEQPQEAPMAWSDPTTFANTSLKNPGKFDQLAREAQAVLQVDNFEGLRLDFNRVISPKFFLGHHLTMGGSDAKESYGFSANFVPNNDNMVGGRVDPSGNLTARVIRQLAPGISTKIEAQIPPLPNPAAVNVDLDALGQTYTLGGKWSSEGLVSGSCVLALTPKLTAAAEALHHPSMAALHLSSRYETPNYVMHGMWGSYGLFVLSYMRKASGRVGLATSLQCNYARGDTFVEAGYCFNLHQAIVRARAASNGTVGCLLEEKLAPGFSLLLSGMIDHFKQDYKFGFGVNIG